MLQTHHTSRFHGLKDGIEATFTLEYHHATLLLQMRIAYTHVGSRDGSISMQFKVYCNYIITLCVKGGGERNTKRLVTINPCFVVMAYFETFVHQGEFEKHSNEIPFLCTNSPWWPDVTKFRGPSYSEEPVYQADLTHYGNDLGCIYRMQSFRAQIYNTFHTKGK